MTEPPDLTKRPEVAFLVYALGHGGAERAVFNYVTHLRRHRPLVVALRSTRGFANLLPPSVPVINRLAPGENGQWFSDNWLSVCLRLRRLLRDRRITTLCSFLRRPNILAVLTKLLAPELRVVINIHEHATGVARYMYPGRANKFLMHRATRDLYPRADVIVCVADFQKHDLVTNFSLPSEKIRTIHNPLDLDAIERSSKAPWIDPFPDCRGPLILAVGSLTEVKGFDLLIRAFAGLPHHEARLLILGDGPRRSRLERLIGELGLNGRVRMPGFDVHPFDYFRRATMLVLSSHSEAFPNVIGEALATGCPVVATDCSGGVRQYLEDGRCGLLVKPGDVDAIREGMEHLLRDAELRQRFSVEGRRRVREFELPRIIEQYEQMLESLP